MFRLSSLFLLAFAAFGLVLAGCAAPPSLPPLPGTGGNASPANDTQGSGAQIANPASVFCKQLGYSLEIRKDATGAESGYCVFGNGRECEEWAFFRGECNETNYLIAGEGETCGGIAGIQCASGLGCRLGGSYPDAGGVCVKQQAQDGFVSCPPGRGEVCTTQHSPVCGRSGTTPSAYGYKDYPNPCVACSRTSPATGYFAGTCAINNLTSAAKKTDELYYCPPDRPGGCSAEYDPVCGRVVDSTSSASFYRDFSNPCMACSAGSNAVAYYIGKCAERKA